MSTGGWVLIFVTGVFVLAWFPEQGRRPWAYTELVIDAGRSPVPHALCRLRGLVGGQLAVGMAHLMLSETV
jgi:hypothetical protein